MQVSLPAPAELQSCKAACASEGCALVAMLAPTACALFVLQCDSSETNPLRWVFAHTHMVRLEAPTPAVPFGTAAGCSFCRQNTNSDASRLIIWDNEGSVVLAAVPGATASREADKSATVLQPETRSAARIDYMLSSDAAASALHQSTDAHHGPRSSMHSCVIARGGKLCSVHSVRWQGTAPSDLSHRTLTDVTNTVYSSAATTFCQTAASQADDSDSGIERPNAQVSWDVAVSALDQAGAVTASSSIHACWPKHDAFNHITHLDSCASQGSKAPGLALGDGNAQHRESLRHSTAAELLPPFAGMPSCAAFGCSDGSVRITPLLYAAILAASTESTGASGNGNRAAAAWPEAFAKSQQTLKGHQEAVTCLCLCRAQRALLQEASPHHAHSLIAPPSTSPFTAASPQLQRQTSSKASTPPPSRTPQRGFSLKSVLSMSPRVSASGRAQPPPPHQHAERHTAPPPSVVTAAPQRPAPVTVAATPRSAAAAPDTPAVPVQETHVQPVESLLLSGCAAGCVCLWRLRRNGTASQELSNPDAFHAEASQGQHAEHPPSTSSAELLFQINALAEPMLDFVLPSKQSPSPWLRYVLTSLRKILQEGCLAVSFGAGVLRRGSCATVLFDSVHSPEQPPPTQGL